MNVYSHPFVSMGDWFQEALLILKSVDAQIPYIKWLNTLNRVGPPYPWGKG